MHSHDSIFPRLLLASLALALPAACTDLAEDGDEATSDTTGELDEEPADELDADGELVAETPVQATEPCRVLALGDSITYGLNSNYFQHINSTYHGGYRAHLVAGFAAIPSASVGPILMVGSTTEYSNPLMMSWKQGKHSGYLGDTNEELTVRVNNEGISDHDPDIILLHSGTNDILTAPSPQSAYALAELNGLLDALHVKNPDATILLAKIIPLAGLYALVGLNNEVSAYNAALDAFALARRNAGQDVWVVDQYTNFPVATLLGDSIHPDWTGYEHMAARWRLAMDAVGCDP